ncbi:MAG: formate/nitrite transporter family protein [Thermoleophilia bacterium]|nr:formate/nitrite transporter family protein [Thermoleophilia bacterium]
MAVHPGETPPAAPAFPAGGLDALPPAEMARRAADVGRAKATLPVASQLALAILAGAFISMGAIFATTATAGGAALPYGVGRLLAGVVFSLGLILVVVAGAELFTGNNLIVMAWASRRVSTLELVRNWAVVYTGNFAGAIATAGLMYGTQQHTFGEGAIGAQALTIASAKTGLGFGQAVALGIMCNALVCMAVWLCYSARTTTDRILAIVPPIAAFVAAGFEHSVANMYFIPAGLFIKADAGVLASLEAPPDLSGLTWGAFVVDNLIPVTIGNIVGGTVLVGALYWFVYLRPVRAGGEARV